MPPLLPRPTATGPEAFPPTVGRVCPECAGPLIRASGCVSCRHCGWARCG